MESNQNKPSILRNQTVWETLYFYQKANSLYGITFYFAHTFLGRGDRTVDQMVQAARSGKQNIVEGSADGMTSTEMELKLLNVARASIKELREDYEDYLRVRGLPLWDARHPKFNQMLHFCRTNNRPANYDPLLPKMNDEQIANMAVTLCHMVDKMMTTYQRQLEKKFIECGGIRERMTAARLGYRNEQKNIIAEKEALIRQLQNENQQLKAYIAQLEQRLKNH